MSEDALLEAIYAAPEDDAPRLVYADALTQRGDPRGEFIIRQLRGEDVQPDPAWLGRIAHVIKEHEYRRGFLFACTIDPAVSRNRLAAVAGDPMWRTVEKLVGPVLLALHPNLRLRELDFDPDHEPDAWRTLLCGGPHALESLTYRLVTGERWSHGGDVTATPSSGGVWTVTCNPDELAALVACTALPKLRTLRVVAPREACLPALEASRVEHVEVLDQGVRHVVR